MYRIEDVICFSQRDNKFVPYVSCYPESMAMVINYCLNYLGLEKKAIGCPLNMQIGDYLNKILSSKDTKKWIRNNVSIFGSWMLKYRPREIAVVEEMIFNQLMNRFGFKCKFKVLKYDKFIELLDGSKFPFVAHGNFKSVSSIGGHITVITGYNKDRFYVNDPFGDALTAYNTHYGKDRLYPKSLYLKKNDTMYVQCVTFDGDKYV